MRIALSFILLLSAPLARAAFCQQPASNPQAPAAAQAAGELKIDFNRRVHMRDRTELSADVYRPVAPGRYPVILLRTPYTKTSASNLKIIKYFVTHGYAVVYMDVRGRGDSDGKFVPYSK